MQIDAFDGQDHWIKNTYTGVVTLNVSSYDYSVRQRSLPEVGFYQVLFPPQYLCDGEECYVGVQSILAEQPYPCPLGYYCRAGVATSLPVPKNFSTPQRCFHGFFCPRGSTTPEGTGPCPTGYYCPNQFEAVPCPPGHYCPGVGNRGPRECYPGTYNPIRTQSNCTLCPLGHICPDWGLLLPEKCPPGFVCSSIGLSIPVVLCPAGFYCAEGTLTSDPSDLSILKPQPCGDGTFCLGGVAHNTTLDWIPTQPEGATAPQYCNEGTFCAQASYLSSGSGLCYVGHYCPPGSSLPTETPPGTFASDTGTVAPTLCFPGTYTPLNATTQCRVCPAGHTCPTYGAYVPTICGTGEYRSSVDSVTCRLCPTGTYSDLKGVTDLSLCRSCPKGRVCGSTQMTNLGKSKSCTTGYICGYGTDTSRQFDHTCPAGHACPSSSSPDEQLDNICAAGYYCERGTSLKLMSQNKCQIGYFCPTGTALSAPSDHKCPRQSTSLAGAENCTQCIISSVDVCDKVDWETSDPYTDNTYYPMFWYNVLDGSGTNVSFDSTSLTSTTGEILALEKVSIFPFLPLS
jgi:hypothetical protein